MRRPPTGTEAGGGSAGTIYSAWQHSNNPRNYAEIQPSRTGNGVTPHFRERGQPIKWKSEWAHANCTVCGAAKVLRVRTSGAFHCTRCGIKGASLNQLQALERKAAGWLS